MFKPDKFTKCKGSTRKNEWQITVKKHSIHNFCNKNCIFPPDEHRKRPPFGGLFVRLQLGFVFYHFYVGMLADVLDGLFQALDLDSLLFGVIPKRCMDRFLR